MENEPVVKRQRSSYLFSVTLPHCMFGKEHVHYALEEICDELITALEKHVDGSDHLHLYMKTTDAWLYDNLKEKIRELIFCGGEFLDDDLPIDIQGCKNAASWIRYVSKEDHDCLIKNVGPSKMNQAWKIMHFVKSNKVFVTHAPFLIGNPHLIPRVREIHQSYWNSVCATKTAVAGAYPLIAVPWAMRAILALRSRKSLYLHGGAGVGKSLLVSAYLKVMNYIPPYVSYLPCGKTDFEWSQVTMVTQFILGGDCPEDYFQTHRSRILTLCDGGYVSINVKCGPIQQFMFEGVVVLISNYPPPEDPAFTRRFVIIHADRDAFVTSTGNPEKYKQAQAEFIAACKNGYDSPTESSSESD